MPKLKPTEKEMMDRHVKAAIQNWQIMHGMDDAATAKKFKVCRQTIWYWKNDPGRIFGKIRTIVKLFGFTDEQILNMIRPER